MVRDPLCVQTTTDLRPLHVAAEWPFGERLFHRRQFRLRTRLAVGETESPVENVRAAAMPLVGPRESEYAGTAD